MRLAASYIVLAFYSGGAEGGFKIGLFLILLPPACIWVSEPSPWVGCGLCRGHHLIFTGRRMARLSPPAAPADHRR